MKSLQESIFDTTPETLDSTKMRSALIREMIMPNYPRAHFNQDLCRDVLAKCVEVKGKSLIFKGTEFAKNSMNRLYMEKFDPKIWKEIDTIEFAEAASQAMMVIGKRLVGGVNCPKRFIYENTANLVADSFERIDIKSDGAAHLNLRYYEKVDHTYFKLVRVNSFRLSVTINDIAQIEQLKTNAHSLEVQFNSDEDPIIDEELLDDLDIPSAIRFINFHLKRSFVEYEKKGGYWTRS